jgi:RNA-binding protein YhbY
MNFSAAQFQIGKQGLTENTILSLNNAFKHHSQIRVSVLKSATRDKEEIIKIAQSISEKTDFKCAYKILGFTIILIRLGRRAKLEKTNTKGKMTKTEKEAEEKRIALQKKTKFKYALKDEKRSKF